ncbi:MAG TPA: hypothetical protein VMV45_19980 [Casimicrobiaceae bacterium]|nr:hypothetical protein [Casimicrobiaceae bacterium]
MKRSLIALATAGVLASGAALAATPAADVHGATAAFVPVQYYGGYDRSDERAQAVNDREARLSARIARAEENGRITHREARMLYRELGDIQARERDFRADGQLGWREAEDLNRDLDRLAGNLRDQIRD